MRGPRLALAVLLAAAAAALPAAAGSAPSRGTGLALRSLGSFEAPVFVSGAQGFAKLLFVVEQPGRIRVLHRGRPLARPFLDISDRVGNGGERGLLSVAFPPDYGKSRRFYVYYTDLGGNIQIDEYRRATPTFAPASSRRALLTIPHPGAANHNGGQLQFHGPELLLASGDGGGGGDPQNNAQNLDSLLGKLLRIIPTPDRGGRPYTVPRSNPFVGRAGRDEIFSYGLRNPWRFSVQLLANRPDRVLIGDVGQSRFEEIDYETLPEASAANFGWDAWEGFAPYGAGCLACPNSGTPDPGGTTMPILAYPRQGDGAAGCTVIGGYVVRDRALATLRGRYVYTDLCNGELRSFVPRLGGAAGDAALGISVPNPSSFGETPDGRLFVASLDGPVYRIVAAP